MGKAEIYNRLKEEKVGGTSKRLLLVEGEDDVAFYQNLFERQYGTDYLLSKNTEIAFVSGKSNVVYCLGKEPAWIGIVDRDEWTEEKIASEQRSCPNLFVLPRYCVESYLTNPDEVRNILSKLTALSITEETHNQFRRDIVAQLPIHLKHGALWHTLFPLKDRLFTDLGFVDFFNTSESADFPNDMQIKEKLQVWSDLVDADRMIAAYESQYSAFLDKPEAEQYSLCVHGKRFWKQAVYLLLREIVKPISGNRQPKENELKLSLFRMMDFPSDAVSFVEDISIRL